MAKLSLPSESFQSLCRVDAIDAMGAVLEG